MKQAIINHRYRSFQVIFSVIAVGCSLGCQQAAVVEIFPSYVASETHSQDIYDLAQSSTVRIVQNQGTGTGVIIYQDEHIYTVLTNWHVVETDNVLSVLTADGQTYQLLQSPQKLGNFDLALIQFQSRDAHQVAPVSTTDPEVGEKIYTAGFPFYEQNDRATDTVAQGVGAFRLTQGEVSVVPSVALPNGYHMGYTNDTAVGMSGGPIFNDRGLLVGVHGRGKHRDPSFGVYTFEDGSKPTPEMLETMIESSWGIPISTYLQFTSQASQN